MSLIIVLLLIIPLQIVIPSCIAQDSNSNDDEQPQHIRIRYNATFEKIFSDYNKEKEDGRPEGGLSDDDMGNEPAGRPTGGLSDSTLDGNGTQDTNYEERPSKGLSDSVLDGTENDNNSGLDMNEENEGSGRPSGGLSDPELEGN